MVNRHVTLIFGPPCAGKTHYAQQHAQPGDTILDADHIAVELGSPGPWDHPEPIRLEAQRLWRQRAEQIGRTASARAWIIRCAPTQSERRMLKRITHATHTVLLLPDHASLQVRAMERPDPDTTKAAIQRWMSTYLQDQASPRVTGRGRRTGRERTSEQW